MEHDAPIPTKYSSENETIYDYYVDNSGKWTLFKGASWVPP